jgi:hypothetical protein
MPSAVLEFSERFADYVWILKIVVGFAAKGGCATVSHQSLSLTAPGKWFGRDFINSVQPFISSLTSIVPSFVTNPAQIRSTV